MLFVIHQINLLVRGSYQQVDLMYHKQPQFTVQRNSLIPYNILLHVSVRTNHNQAFIITIKKSNHILAPNCAVSEISLHFGYLLKLHIFIS